MRSALLILSALMLIPLPSRAETIVTDRPDVAESSLTVGEDFVQVEAGADLSRTSSTSTLVLPTKLRVGLSESLELHLESDLQSFPLDGPGERALVDFDLGGKAHFFTRGRFSLGLLIAFTIPAADGSAFAFAPTLALDVDLLSWMGLGINAGWTAPLQERDMRSDVFRFATSLGVGVPSLDALGFYAELFGEVPLGDDPTTLWVDGGATFLVLDNLQLDAYLRRSLNLDEAETGLGLGVSFKL